jgi:hypothetical protein
MMTTNKALPADIELTLKQYGKHIAFLRRHPTHAVRVLFGIVVPPHESSLLEVCWLGYRDNIIKCSRGTSKTFTVGSLFAPLKALLFRNSRVLVASASRFRGGKQVIKDSERLITGQLDSQTMPGHWAQGAIAHAKVVKHEPDMWNIEFKSHSTVFTIPTNNEEAVRGLRANIMIIDERNTFDGEAIQKVYIPFLNVGRNFANPAQGASGNQVFSVGTIDYSYRDWHKEIMTAKDIIRIQYEAHKAMMQGDWGTYDSLMARHGKRLRTMSTAFVRYDYTDLLIPTELGGYRVHYPGAKQDKDIMWDERDQIDYIYTYPVSKTHLESSLDEGIVDKESWEAEQRNMFIRASGSVYPPSLVEKVTGPIFTIQEELKRKWDAQDQGTRYLPPVLYETADPCVLGVDTARTADFTAFVIIRIGDLPTSHYTGNINHYALSKDYGPTLWSNVVWAEQHQHLTTRETANLLYEFRQRYNIVGTFSYPGVVMDARGGGAHVRDELAEPSPPLDTTGRPLANWKAPQRIYDVDDAEFQHLRTDADAWPGLKLLMTTDLMNQELISYSRAQMDAGRLYVGAYKTPSERFEDKFELNNGYLGARVLKHQMLRIQAESTPSGKSVRFVMPGDPRKIENKKDMLMAFLYACYGLRHIHNVFARDAFEEEPVSYGTIVRF